jgi:hypothetical protein
MLTLRNNKESTMVTPRVGGEVDAFCTRCKMILAHTIVAMEGSRIARVLCNTCKGDHVYRAGPPGESRPTSRSSSEGKPRPTVIVTTYDEKIRGREISAARPYNVKDDYKVDDLLRHPSFGLGIVLAIRGLQKIEVMFPTDVKVLLQNKGVGPPRASPLPRPVPEAPASEEPEPAVPAED